MRQAPPPLLQALRAHAKDDVCVLGDCEHAVALRKVTSISRQGDTRPLELAVLVLNHADGAPTPDMADIARARDIDARRCPAWICDSTAWPDDTLRALGFSPVTEHLWGYNIADYKPVPDWLNPRHWANPELWDKHRW